MNETKHTPGPWIAKHWQPGHHRSMVLTVDAGGATTIATMGWINGEANANLIAAAPDLYAALREAASEFDGAARFYRNEMAGFVGASIVERIEACARKARAALAKAEGGAK